jgi:RimJ/RimL family protein N-acetyltransferase
MNFDFQQDFTLENNFVLLRPLQNGDYEHLLDYALNEPDIWKYNAWGASGADGLRKYIDTALEKRNAGCEYPYIVFNKETGTYAGSTRFYDIQHERNTIQIGYTWYGKAHQGTALNKACKYLLLDFAFETLGVDRVGFGANANNARSIAAMKSIGCTQEGILRSASLGSNGERIDIAVLSILKPEWEQALRTQLADKFAEYS